MEYPSVAIITVFYNREDHVYESIKSLTSQTYSNLQIIVIDDCSTDSTFDRIKSLEGADNRLKIMRNSQNKGFTQTLIDSIKSLNVKYVAIHGAGDVSLPTRVEVQVKYLEGNPEVGVVTVDIANLKKPKFHQTEITLKHLLRKNRVTHGAVMFRLDDYFNAGGYRAFFTTRQDKDLWFRMSLITKIHFLNKKLYRLTSIERTVTLEASFTGIPILLSEFSKFLILERLKYDKDPLEIYGEKGVLFFNSTQANKQLFINFLLSVSKKRIDHGVNYLDILIRINSNPFLLLVLKSFKAGLNPIAEQSLKKDDGK